MQDTSSSYPPRIVIVMGVSGCGKTTIGSHLAHMLNSAPFIDADSLHPPHNVEKMAKGIALTDSDRLPWLALVRKQLDIEAQKLLDMPNTRERPMYVVCGCSALKRGYRELLSQSSSETHVEHPLVHNDVVFVYIDVSREELVRRLARRREHFFNPVLLDTQLATLEVPDTIHEEAIVVDGCRPTEHVVEEAYEKIKSYVYKR